MEYILDPHIRDDEERELSRHLYNIDLLFNIKDVITIESLWTSMRPMIQHIQDRGHDKNILKDITSVYEKEMRRTILDVGPHNVGLPRAICVMELRYLGICFRNLLALKNDRPMDDRSTSYGWSISPFTRHDAHLSQRIVPPQRGTYERPVAMRPSR